MSTYSGYTVLKVYCGSILLSDYTIIPPFISLSADTSNIPFRQTNRNMTVSSNTEWYLSISDSWASVTPSSGSGVGNTIISFDANSGDTERTIYITGTTRTSGATSILSFVQDKYRFINMTADTSILPYTQTDRTISVSSNTEWDLSISDSWASVTPSSGSGVGNAVISFEANSGDTERTIYITGTTRIGEVESVLSFVQNKYIPVPTGTSIIYYTSSDGNIVTPYTAGTEIFGANIVSNTYSEGVGQIVFDGIVTKIGRYAFRDKMTLRSIIIPDTVTEIGYAFNQFRCSAITIPDSVISIGPSTFNGSEYLSEIHFGTGIRTLGDYVFNCCYALTAFTMPNTVTYIGTGLFNGSKIRNCDLGSTITSIPNRCFRICFNLRKIDIPINITSIGDYAFEECNNLTTINYAGTMAQWNNVTKGTNWHHDVPASVVHCADGDVSL